MLDQTDLKILKLLEENSRMQWREIGELVHLTGPAVANRVQNMEKIGVIEKFTVQVNRDHFLKSSRAFVTMFMNSNDHQPFIQFCQNEIIIRTVHRVSGEGCYLLEILVSSVEQLDSFLDRILQFGNYKLQMSIKQFK
ncbi:Lrp/AsnC family transcriptional regulator [Seinonella peptonophila]|nr:Lrp/AsnC family transcriptional regulator [Seinonella peptonophila]